MKESPKEDRVREMREANYARNQKANAKVIKTQKTAPGKKPRVGKEIQS